MKIYFLFLSMVLCLFTLKSSAEGTAERPRRFIFLVHGLKGSVKTFGQLREVLEEHGRKIQPNTEFHIIPVSYATGSQELNTYNFAEVLAKTMTQEIGTLRSSDRITLLAHSQGGLISWIWYVLSLEKEGAFARYYPLAQQTEGLMTLGSPMWGSKLASFLRSNPKLRKLSKRMGFGQEELKEMSYGSDTILRFRNRAMSLDRAGVALPLRALAVGGVLNPINDASVSPFNRYLLGMAQCHLGSGCEYRTESDIAVSLPSSRFEFIYLNPEKAAATEIRAEDFSYFKQKRLTNFTIVKAPHASWDQKTFYDMAEVPLDCRDLSHPCTHPTYPLILSFTMACTPQVADCRQEEHDKAVKAFTETQHWKEEVMPGDLDLGNMHSFLIDMVLQLPSNYEMPEQSEILKMFRFDSQRGYYIYSPQDPSYVIKLNRLEEFQSHVLKVDKVKKQIRLTMHGHGYQNPAFARTDLYRAQVKKGFQFPMTIQLPGLTPRKLEVLVKPTYSTFIQLDLRN